MHQVRPWMAVAASAVPVVTERQFIGVRRSTRRLIAAESTGSEVRTRRSRVLCLQDRRRGRHLPGLATAVRSVPTSAASSDSDYNTLLLIVVARLSPLLGERLASAGDAYGSRLTWSRRRQGRHPKDSDTLEPPISYERGNRPLVTCRSHSMYGSQG